MPRAAPVMLVCVMCCSCCQSRPEPYVAALPCPTAAGGHAHKAYLPSMRQHLQQHLALQEALAVGFTAFLGRHADVLVALATSPSGSPGKAQPQGMISAQELDRLALLLRCAWDGRGGVGLAAGHSQSLLVSCMAAAVTKHTVPATPPSGHQRRRRQPRVRRRSLHPALAAAAAAARSAAAGGASGGCPRVAAPWMSAQHPSQVRRQLYTFHWRHVLVLCLAAGRQLAHSCACTACGI